MTQRLRVDPIACDGHGTCAELFPEWIRLDDWGFPIVPAEPLPNDLVRLARSAAAACPRLALRLEGVEAARPAGRPPQ